MAYRIAVDSGTQLVEVGDGGETIAFRMSDTDFQRGFVDFVEWAMGVEPRQKDIAERIKSMSVRNEGYFDALRENFDISDEAASLIDELFGAGTCIKVFGSNTPDFMSVLDFAYQISDIYAALSGAVMRRRSESIGRYSRHRGDV